MRVLDDEGVLNSLFLLENVIGEIGDISAEFLLYRRYFEYIGENFDISIIRQKPFVFDNSMQNKSLPKWQALIDSSPLSLKTALSSGPSLLPG